MLEALTPKPKSPLPNESDEESSTIESSIVSSFSKLENNKTLQLADIDKYLKRVFNKHSEADSASSEEYEPDLLKLSDLQYFHTILLELDLIQKKLAILQPHIASTYPKIKKDVDDEIKDLEINYQALREKVVNHSIYPKVQLLLAHSFPKIKENEVDGLLPIFYNFLKKMDDSGGLKSIQDKVRIIENTRILVGDSESNDLVLLVLKNLKKTSSFEGFIDFASKPIKFFSFVRNAFTGEQAEKNKLQKVFSNLKSMMPDLIQELKITYEQIGLEEKGLVDFLSLEPLLQKKAMRMALSHPNLNQILVNNPGISNEEHQPQDQNNKDQEPDQEPEESSYSDLFIFLSSLDPEKLLEEVQKTPLEQFSLPDDDDDAADAIVNRFAQLAELLKKQVAKEICKHMNPPTKKTILKFFARSPKKPTSEISLDIHPISQRREYDMAVDLAFRQITEDILELSKLLTSMKNIADQIKSKINLAPISKNKSKQKDFGDYNKAREATINKLAEIDLKYDFFGGLKQFFTIPLELTIESTPDNVSTLVTKLTISISGVNDLFEGLGGAHEKSRQAPSEEVINALDREKILGLLKNYLQTKKITRQGDNPLISVLVTLLEGDNENEVVGNPKVIELVRKLDAYLKSLAPNDLAEVNIKIDILGILDKIESLPPEVGKMILDVFGGIQVEKDELLDMYELKIKALTQKNQQSTDMSLSEAFQPDALFGTGEPADKLGRYLSELTLPLQDARISNITAKQSRVNGVANNLAVLKGVVSGMNLKIMPFVEGIFALPELPKLTKVGKNYGIKTNDGFTIFSTDEKLAASLYDILKENYVDNTYFAEELQIISEIQRVVVVLKTIRDKGTKTIHTHFVNRRKTEHSEFYTNALRGFIPKLKTSTDSLKEEFLPLIKQIANTKGKTNEFSDDEDLLESIALELVKLVLDSLLNGNKIM